MIYDSVVIGAGLAGLVATMRLAEAGHRVALLAAGIGGTHLAPGTIDVLGYNGGRVESPAEALPSFVAEHPAHPYARLSAPLIGEAVDWFKGRMEPLGYVGGLDQNVLLPTAVGVPRPSAVVPETMAGGDLRGGGRFVLAGFRALKDFYPAYLADNLSRAELPAGASVEARSVELIPPMDGEADVGALGFARRFEDPGFRRAVITELGPHLELGEAVGFPAVLGLADAPAVWRELQRELGRTVFEVPTLPPSVPGIRVFRILRDAIRRAGARVVIGGRVTGAESPPGWVEAVAIQAAARPITFRARSFVLATGGVASGGLDMDSYGTARETVFGLPVAGMPGEGESRFGPGYFDHHAMSRVGLAVDERFRPVDADGRPVFENLFAAGATLAGAEPWREKSGDGISLSTGYAAAGAILEEVP